MLAVLQSLFDLDTLIFLGLFIGPILLRVCSALGLAALRSVNSRTYSLRYSDFVGFRAGFDTGQKMGANKFFHIIDIAARVL